MADITLAIDTIGGRCATAVIGAAGETLGNQQSHMERGHAEALIPQIDQCLAEAGLAYGDIARIGVTTGPGSFTSVRVGLSVAKAMALALNVPLFGLSSLQIATLGCAPDEPLLVILAGRGETVFWQYFDRLDDTHPYPALRQSLAGPGNDPLADISARYPKSAVITDPPINPADFGRLVQSLNDPEQWPGEPHYLRCPDAAPANPLFSIRPIDGTDQV